jgi:hypothetical protein
VADDVGRQSSRTRRRHTAVPADDERSPPTDIEAEFDWCVAATLPMATTEADGETLSVPLVVAPTHNVR